MNRSTTILVSVAIVAAIAFLLWDHKRATVAVNDNAGMGADLVGASVVPGNPVGPDLTANVSYLYPPPLAAMVPQSTTPGGSAAVTMKSGAVDLPASNECGGGGGC